MRDAIIIRLGWAGLELGCTNGAICLSVDCCFNYFYFYYIRYDFIVQSRSQQGAESLQ